MRTIYKFEIGIQFLSHKYIISWVHTYYKLYDADQKKYMN
jgi:hypothetical protein